MRTVLITGANRGIGLELCRLLAARGDQVIAACRSSNDDLNQIGVQVIEGVDVADDASVARLAEAVKGETLDLLINNAGILKHESFDNLDFAAMRDQFEINALGPLRVTAALQGNLQSGSKIVVITSRVGSVGDNSSGGIYGYRMSKSAANMAAKNLSIDFADRGIPVGIFHPGLVATEMTGGRGITPSESAEGLIARADELSMETTGEFVHASGEKLPW